MRTRALLAVGALLLVTACSSSEPQSTKPTFGGGSDDTTSTVKPVDLAAAKAAAGIEDCPEAGETSTGADTLPGIVLPCLGGGRSVDLARLAGTPTVINLWASWCVPCRKELPVLAKADAAYGDSVRFVGIDFRDPNPDHAIELAKASGVTYPLLADPDQKTKAELRVVGLPQTVFVDAKGRVVATERVAYDSYADLTAAIERHLGVTP